jgi:heat shock protein HspQ
MTAQAQFAIGQVVHHRKFDYRGVVVDVDAEFDGPDDWYEEVARSRPPRDKPWYHVLVDDSDRITYVAERHLEADDSSEPVIHPALATFFAGFEHGSYRLRQRAN